MNIAIVFKHAILPAIKYGGTQRIAWDLGKTLVNIGHKVHFLVDGKSKCDFAKVIPYNSLKSIEEQLPNDIEVIHLFHLTEEKFSKPYIVRIGINPLPTEELDINSVFVSKNHAERYNAKSFIHNGLDWENYPKPNLNSKKNYNHFLGKANWKVKNVFGAAKIVTMIEEELYILGGERWTFRNFKRGGRYLFHKNLHFMGMVDNEEKILLMNNSKALIFPVNWHEPFGIAIIESLYAGCAIFGSKNGSLNELITPEIGCASNSYLELSSAIKNFDYSPKHMNEYAVENFNALRMTNEYLKLYYKVIKGITLNDHKPTFNSTKNKVELMS